MIRINTSEELSLYDLEGKWNDYIGVQKEVLKVLRNKNYFESNEVIPRYTCQHQPKKKYFIKKAL